MATYTSNYAWTKPGGNDPVDISVLNGNLDSQDAIMHKAFMNMAQAFSQLSTYAVGDIVLYDNDLYKCHTAVVTPGSWTGSTNWTSWTLAEGGGGTSNYPNLTNKPSINGVTLTGNKTTSDLGIDKTAVGLGNVPNVATNDQEPTFTEASTRNNIASGEKLSVILGKIQKFFNDLKTVAFTGSFSDLTDKPSINSVTLSGNKTASDLGINADNVMLSDSVTSVESVFTYSEAEHVVGKWIDGKTVYEKTVYCGNLPNNTYKDTAHNISNFGKLIELKGATSSGIPIPYAASVLANCISAFVTATNIRLVTGTDLSPYTAYVTIRYTKSS